MDYLISGVLGYLVGCVNPSYIISKQKGFDLRKRGSNNAGGSNAFITMGPMIGVFCMLFDLVKAYVVVKLVAIFISSLKLAALIAGVTCIIGHMFPVFMGFKGGKGLACIGGSILAYKPWLFLVMIVILGGIAFLIDYICFVPISASITFPIIYYILESNLTGVLIICIASVAVLWKHTENLKRIHAGTEARLSYIWNKDEELKRVEQNNSERREK